MFVAAVTAFAAFAASAAISSALFGLGALGGSRRFRLLESRLFCVTSLFDGLSRALEPPTIAPLLVVCLPELFDVFDFGG